MYPSPLLIGDLFIADPTSAGGRRAPVHRLIHFGVILKGNVAQPPQELPHHPGTRQHVNIKLGSKRYQLTVVTKAEELKPKPAQIIELPKRQA